MRVMLPLMNLIITKWLLVFVLENKHNLYVIHFLSLTVKKYLNQQILTITEHRELKVFVYRHWCEENKMVSVSHELPFPATSD